MEDILAKRPAPPKRAYLRIPINLKARVFIEGRFNRNVYLNDLSTTGLSFNIKLPESLPDIFELRFQLDPLSPEIKIQVAIKNRLGAKDMLDHVRIGGIFVALSEKNRNAIDRYLCRAVDLSAPPKLITIASFLCLLDALLRILGYSVIFQYRTVKLGENITIFSFQNPYLAILVLYAGLSLTSFIFSTDITGIKERNRFLLAFSSLAFAFSFLVIKNIMYWNNGIWSADIGFVKGFLLAQILILICTAAAVFFSLVSLKKINSTLAVFGLHQEHPAPKDTLNSSKLDFPE
ncbi:MAG: PilZ domain-containing protein [Candidatus Omnitrophica bacterium]|nr:PilZ domain-containing protein [Candidatus Omnitrophota bacterium]